MTKALTVHIQEPEAGSAASISMSVRYGVHIVIPVLGKWRQGIPGASWESMLGRSMQHVAQPSPLVSSAHHASWWSLWAFFAPAEEKAQTHGGPFWVPLPHVDAGFAHRDLVMNGWAAVFPDHAF